MVVHLERVAIIQIGERSCRAFWLAATVAAQQEANFAVFPVSAPSEDRTLGTTLRVSSSASYQRLWLPLATTRQPVLTRSTEFTSMPSRSGRRLQPQLEGLEGRELLSTGALPHSPDARSLVAPAPTNKLTPTLTRQPGTCASSSGPPARSSGLRGERSLKLRDTRCPPLSRRQV